MTPRIPCSRTQRSISAPAPGVARIDRRERDEPLRRRRDPGGERVVCGGDRPQQPLVGEDDRDVDAELVHHGEVLLRRRRPLPAGWWTWKSITPAPSLRDAGGVRDPLGQLEARDRLVEPGHGRPAGKAGVDEALELEREADLGLVARRLERLRRPVGELDGEAEGRWVERRQPERPGDDELAPGQHRREPDDLEPGDAAVGVGERRRR